MSGDRISDPLSPVEQSVGLDAVEVVAELSTQCHRLDSGFRIKRKDAEAALLTMEFESGNDARRTE